MQGIVICGKGMWLENALFEIDRISKYPNIGSKIYKDKNGATMLLQHLVNLYLYSIVIQTPFLLPFSRLR